MANEKKNCTKCKWLTFLKNHLNEDLPVCRHEVAVNYRLAEPEAWYCTYFKPKDGEQNG